MGRLEEGSADPADPEALASSSDCEEVQGWKRCLVRAEGTSREAPRRQIIRRPHLQRPGELLVSVISMVIYPRHVSNPVCKDRLLPTIKLGSGILGCAVLAEGKLGQL
jgi:hypothetical protein